MEKLLKPQTGESRSGMLCHTWEIVSLSLFLLLSLSLSPFCLSMAYCLCLSLPLHPQIHHLLLSLSLPSPYHFSNHLKFMHVNKRLERSLILLASHQPLRNDSSQCAGVVGPLSKIGRMLSKRPRMWKVPREVISVGHTMLHL